MMDYSVHILARSEHEVMVRSVPTVYDYANLGSSKQSRWSRLMAGLRAVAGHVLTSSNPPPRSRPTLKVSDPSPLLREQLGEDSNCELDWLWAADQVTAAEEIRYCLERALYINPDNHKTQRALSDLVVQYAAFNETRVVNRRRLTHVSNN
jgi:hypothetical protein